MTSKHWTRALSIFALIAAIASTSARAGVLEDEIAVLQHDWAIANYEITAPDAKVRALEALSERASALAARYPQRAEPLVWEGIILSTCAGAKGGLGALGLAKRARARLEAAIAVNPDVLDGSAYTSLGTLYYKVPGFPLGFGNDTKARSLLEKALAANPDGIDANFFFGEYLYEEGELAEAQMHLERALRAAPRPGRELADEGRRNEATALLARIVKRDS